MKKIISSFILLIIINMLILNVLSYASEDLNISVDVPTIARPGETVELFFNFGDLKLKKYNFEILYDSNIFDYIRVNNGTANDSEGGLGDSRTKKLTINYNQEETPIRTMKVTFKAKEELTTSNTTEFKITGKEFKDINDSEDYNEAKIDKQILVEPEYIPYDIKLTAEENILKNKEIPMKLSYSSAMGRYYEKARLIATAVVPEGATVKLLGEKLDEKEYDIIEEGWGSTQGYGIGGANVVQELNLTGIFSEAGKYDITLKLIDLAKSNETIAEKTFSFNVLDDVKPQVASETTVEPPIQENTTNEVEPTVLPKTGVNIYVPVTIILSIIAFYCVYSIKKK